MPKLTPAYRALTFTVVVVLSLWGLAISRGRAQNPPVPGVVLAGDLGFRSTVNEFIESEFRIFPESATWAGDHRFDAKLEDLSATGIANESRHAKKWIARFSAFASQALSPANEADREFLAAQCNGELLRIDQLHDYAREPDMYLPTSAIDQLVKRNFAPLAVRMDSVTARETAALRNLAAARSNLDPRLTAPVTIDITLEQMAATIRYFSNDLPAAFASVPDTPAKRAFGRANAKLIAAIEDYRNWLGHTLRHKASGSFAIGAKAYSRMLADDDMVDIPLAQIEAAGVLELSRLQAEFRKSTAQVNPKAAPAAVAASLERQHPAADHVIPEVRAGLTMLRTFVISHHIATIPSAVMPIVAETPPYMRATTFASMDTVGPLEKSKESYFYVTLPDPSWPPEKQEQLLAFYAPATISDTSVHEVFPGHYVQFLNNRLNPDRVRTLYSSGANVEGWALYCEQMMLDEGLHRGEPAYRVAELQMALLRACRYLVGIRMHTQAMTVAQAQAFFERNAYQTPHNARVEALRGTGDPGYLRYQLGKLMILKLRADVQAKEGSAFDLGRFHDAFLREGAIPIKLIRRDMLHSDGPLL